MCLVQVCCSSAAVRLRLDGIGTSGVSVQMCVVGLDAGALMFYGVYGHRERLLVSSRSVAHSIRLYTMNDLPAPQQTASMIKWPGLKEFVQVLSFQ